MVDHQSDIAEAIIHSLVEDPHVDFPQNQIISGQRSWVKTKAQLSVGGVLVAYADGRGDTKIITGKPLARTLRYVVSVGRKQVETQKKIEDDVESVIRCLHRKRHNGISLTYLFDGFNTVINDVLWFDVTFETPLLALEDHD